MAAMGSAAIATVSHSAPVVVRIAMGFIWC